MLDNLQTKISNLEQQGFLHVRGCLEKELIEILTHELNELETQVSEKFNPAEDTIILSATRTMIHSLYDRNCCALNQLIETGTGINIISAAVGGQPICWTSTYANCKPGHPSLPFHTDYSPYKTERYRPNHPSALRALYYLDDLSPTKCPIHIVPHSHNFLHQDYQPDILTDLIEKYVYTPTVKAGDLIIINPRLIHGTGPNLSNEMRRVIAITYVPEWSKSI